MQSTLTVHSATINWVSEYVLDTVALCRTELTILPVSLSLSLSFTHSLTHFPFSSGFLCSKTVLLETARRLLYIFWLYCVCEWVSKCSVWSWLALALTQQCTESAGRRKHPLVLQLQLFITNCNHFFPVKRHRQSLCVCLFVNLSDCCW